MTELKKAKEMYQYSCDNGFGTGFGKNWGLKNYLFLEKKLAPDEAAFLTFVGLHRFRSMSTHQRNFAYAITNKRVLMGQVRSFGRTRFESVPLNAVLNISFDNDKDIGVMKIMLPQDAITVGMARETANALSREMTILLPVIQRFARELAADETPETLEASEVSEASEADETPEA